MTRLLFWFLHALFCQPFLGSWIAPILTDSPDAADELRGHTRVRYELAESALWANRDPLIDL